MTGSQTDVGSIDNSFTVRVLDDNGNNVTHNYSINEKFGYLTVTAIDMGVSPMNLTGDPNIDNV